jgi:hypothetical protein
VDRVKIALALFAAPRFTCSRARHACVARSADGLEQEAEISPQEGCRRKRGHCKNLLHSDFLHWLPSLPQILREKIKEAKKAQAKSKDDVVLQKMAEQKRPVRLPTEDQKAKLDKELREHVAAMKPSNLGKRKRKSKRRTLQDHVSWTRWFCDCSWVLCVSPAGAVRQPH